MSSRPIKAVFYQDMKAKNVIRTNHSATANNAVASAFKRMQTNQYEANLVEVYNSLTGKLYAVIVWRDVGKKLETVYRGKIEEFHRG